MTEPRRIQRKRTKGWRKPPGTICVTRPGKWGNPFKVGDVVTRDSELWKYVACTVPNPEEADSLPIRDAATAAWLYLAWFLDQRPDVTELAGRNLACYCPVGAPC